MGIEAQGAVCPLPALAGRFTPEDILTRRTGLRAADDTGIGIGIGTGTSTGKRERSA